MAPGGQGQLIAAAEEERFSRVLDLEKFEQAVVGRELKMMTLEKELASLRREVERFRAVPPPRVP
jgi:hypothetical protein